MRLIDDEGEQLGIVPVREAQRIAKEKNLDLVLVAEKADPPVCRILDFGKLVYDQKKKQRDSKKHQHAQKLKEVKFRVRIDAHDYSIKINHAIDFLGKGSKVKVSLMFRGREAAHKEIGFELIERVTKDLEEYGVPEGKAALSGRMISLSFNPVHR